MAFTLGRTEFAKTLIEGGADQSVRNARGDNLIHAALAHLPKAHLLEPMLQLLDPDLRRYLLVQRNNLSVSGTTPVHTWVLLQGRTPYASDTDAKYTGYRTKEEKLAVLRLLLGYSGGAELEMLNGAGETPLHSAVMNRQADMVEGLLAYSPKLLYRENAVGRTPAEVARGLVMSVKFAKPRIMGLRYGGTDYENGAARLRHVEPGEFIKARRQGRTIPLADVAERRGFGTQEAEMAVWDIMADYMARHPGQRRLVSLGEANDVVKRLSEKFGAMSLKADGGRWEDEEDGEDEEEDYGHDFAVLQRNSKLYQAWKP